MKDYLHQIHHVLPVQNVLATLFYYTNKLGFEIAFADDATNPTYTGVKHDAKEWETVLNTPMLRIKTENVEVLFEDYKIKRCFTMKLR